MTYWRVFSAHHLTLYCCVLVICLAGFLNYVLLQNFKGQEQAQFKQAEQKLISQLTDSTFDNRLSHIDLGVQYIKVIEGETWYEQGTKPVGQPVVIKKLTYQSTHVELQNRPVWYSNLMQWLLINVLGAFLFMLGWRQLRHHGAKPKPAQESVKQSEHAATPTTDQQTLPQHTHLACAIGEFSLSKHHSRQLIRLQIEQIKKSLSSHQQITFKQLKADGRFLLLIRNTSPDLAEQLIAQFHQQWSHLIQARFEEKQAPKLFIGGCVYEAGQNHSLIYEYAEKALTYAQCMHVKGVHLITFEQACELDIEADNEFSQQLLSEFNHENLLFAFQPVFNMATLQIEHHEVFARMKVPGQGVLQANDFISQLSNQVTSSELDKFTLQKITRMLELEKNVDGRCSVNIAEKSWQSAEFCNWLTDFISSQTPSRLMLEIPEKCLLNPESHLLPTLKALQVKGILLIVDKVTKAVLDAGYLHRFPINKAKLDYDLTHQLLALPERQQEIRTIKNLCSQACVECLALGVESKSELLILQKIGLQGAQGNYFVEPSKQLSLY